MDRNIRFEKYLNREVTPPAKELMERIQEPMDAAKALDPKDINQLIECESFEVEAGWCHKPDHTAYVAMLTKMPGVTLDMLRWWFAWHALEDVRYQIWYPPCHYGISVSEEQRKFISDPDVPLKEKTREVTHFVVEDFYGRGRDVPPFNIHFRNPSYMGFDESKIDDKKFAIFCACPTPGVDVPNSGFMSSFAHVARAVDGGVELRSRFFQGYTFIDRQPVIMTSAEKPVPPKAPGLMCRHCAEEYANLAAILPEIYSEEKENWL